MEFCDAGSLATVIMKLEPLNEDQICIVMKDKSPLQTQDLTKSFTVISTSSAKVPIN
jgi:hypothetical protein